MTTDTTPPPASKGRLTHCTCMHGHIRWHWYEDASGKVQVCGVNRKALEAALKADGYEIKPDEQGATR